MAFLLYLDIEEYLDYLEALRIVYTYITEDCCSSSVLIKRENTKLNIKVNKISATLQFLTGLTSNASSFICYKNGAN
jgi:hypothetical protein